MQEVSTELAAAQKAAEAAEQARSQAEAAMARAEEVAEERRSATTRLGEECEMLHRALEQALAQVWIASLQQSATAAHSHQP